MESVITAVVTGALTLVGVLASNSRGRALIEAKLDELSARVDKHNRLIERAYALEQDVAVLKHDVEQMGEIRIHRPGYAPRAILSATWRGWACPTRRYRDSKRLRNRRPSPCR